MLQAPLRHRFPAAQQDFSKILAGDDSYLDLGGGQPRERARGLLGEVAAGARVALQWPEAAARGRPGPGGAQLGDEGRGKGDQFCPAGLRPLQIHFRDQRSLFPESRPGS